MSTAWAETLRPTGAPTRALSNAALWVAVFLGGFVFIEPAPYDLFLAIVIPLWMLSGLAVPRAVAPLLVLLILFLAGGVLAATQARHLDAQPLYMAVTGFLALGSCFFACVTAQDSRRFDMVVSGWIAGAVVTSLLGILGYFGLTGESFVRYGRATGGFQDPNVFGPFLIFPFLILVRRAMTRGLGSAFVDAALALIIFVGIFLSFSRAAWALTLFGAVTVAGLLFITERSPAARARIVALGIAGAVLLTVLLAAALSVPAISELFQERAQVVQDYDSGHMGRFERHAVGFNMMLDHPLGIGAMEFGKIFGEDEHDIWLKTLTTYGWLGFGAFLTLVIWTLAGAFPLQFRGGAQQGVAQVAFVVFAGHIVMATIIDIDHWRHVFLLFGLLWGLIAAERAARHRMVRMRAGRSGLRAEHSSTADRHCEAGVAPL